LSGTGDANVLAGNLFGGSTAFSHADAKLTVAADHLTASAVHFTGAGYTVDFSGEAPLQTAQISGRGALSIVGTAPAKPALAIPFAIGGTWMAPRLVPDFSALSRRAALDGAAPADRPGLVHRLARHLASIL
jgi:hypothetical protein